MEAMDRLLLACRSSSLNLIVESFLKIVTALLESNEIGLQICATSSVCLSSLYYIKEQWYVCLLYTSPSPRDKRQSRMPSSA